MRLIQDGPGIPPNPLIHQRPANAAGVTSTVSRNTATARARSLLMQIQQDREPPPYPMTALGPLAEVCATLATEAQVQPAMAGQCLLGAASLLVQGLHNVESLAGPRPLSLYLLTLGDSGDGKSTAQEVALRAVTEWQRHASEDYLRELADHEAAKVARKRGDEPPTAPLPPYRLCRDSTVEGLRRDLATGPSAQGVFTDEAAAILSGYGMSPDHRAKTASVFSGLWDNGHLSVSRATGGRFECHGRRVALHWLIQPTAAAESLSDPLLSSLGFWPRFVVASPAPTLPRLARPFRPHTLSAVLAYWRRCTELLDALLPVNVNNAPVLPLSRPAHEQLCGVFERLERDSRAGPLRPIKPFGLRASEQACRVAGVLAAFAGRAEVSGEDMAGALALVAYNLQTWRAVIDDGVVTQAVTASQALRLYTWMTGRPGWSERLAVIVKDGPSCTRSRDKRDAALELLQAHGLVDVADGRAVALLAPEGER